MRYDRTEEKEGNGSRGHHLSQWFPLATLRTVDRTMWDKPGH
jgi:hypothetical protein